MDEIILTEQELYELYLIRYKLKKKGYTQRLLASKYGISRQYMNMILNGKKHNYKIINDLKKLVDKVN